MRIHEQLRAQNAVEELGIGISFSKLIRLAGFQESEQSQVPAAKRAKHSAEASQRRPTPAESAMSNLLPPSWAADTQEDYGPVATTPQTKPRMRFEAPRLYEEEDFHSRDMLDENVKDLEYSFTFPGEQWLQIEG
mmetsp:Transcript_17009/g.26347  ORF Transcript_17009/g.26347 Transcript_17009/m.26347 type:complete len:135 (+) Transcript_17009:675-1079(+)